MYQSPIDVIVGQMNLRMENEICKAVQNVGVTVDKEELLKALQYDRGQYQKGYKDKDDEIVRCKDCKRGIRLDDTNYFVCTKPFAGYREAHTGDWFCADGERFYTEECK